MGNLMLNLICEKCGEKTELMPGFSANGHYYHPYYCRECNKIFDIKESSKKICKICKSELEKIEWEEIENLLTTIDYKCYTKIKCDKCNSTDFKIVWTGFWD